MNFKEIMHFQYIWPRPSTRTHALVVMKFTILVDPLLFIIIYIQSVWSMLRSSDEDFREHCIFPI